MRLEMFSLHLNKIQPCLLCQYKWSVPTDVIHAAFNILLLIYALHYILLFKDNNFLLLLLEGKKRTLAALRNPTAVVSPS